MRNGEAAALSVSIVPQGTSADRRFAARALAIATGPVIAKLPRTDTSCFFHHCNLLRRQVEQGVHAGIEQRLQADDLAGAFVVLRLSGRKPLLPLVALADGDVALERLA